MSENISFFLFKYTILYEKDVYNLGTNKIPTSVCLSMHVSICIQNQPINDRVILLFGIDL